MNENPKFYRITSYLTAKGRRFSTFKYTMSENGTLQFFNRDTHSGMTIGPPYIIEETLLSPGVLPSGPDFPASN
ncbi:MAG: hypothetical protein B7Z37_16165 [Verrucomicrobia bacterium 12-59-8]|nr:MAG: hypothetical protein B7Z37_16165 [Verrucomicrobia bacterium 12-59-8]